MSTVVTTRAACAARDAADPLAPLRARFALPDGVLYLDGNSLGPLPVATRARVTSVVDREWGTDLITSWNRHGWIDLPRRIGDKIGHLVGAAPGEVVVADSTSVNLFKILSAALGIAGGRCDIVSERGNFPTDLYIAQGLLDLRGRGRLRLVDRAEVAEAIDDSTAAVLLTQVDYRTGARHDMAATTRAIQARGALAVWDLAHSAGAFPVDLGAARADFAVGCGYKYLNGGPGAPAFLYVATRHQDAARQPLAGWLGHAAPFAFDAAYAPARGIDRFLCGTPPVLSMAALETGVDIMLEADPLALVAKSQDLIDLFVGLVEAWCGDALTLVTPRGRDARGSQASFACANGYAVMQALIADGVVGDFRAPDIVRFGFCPLYLRYVDVWDAADRLRTVLADGRWRRPEFAARARVT